MILSALELSQLQLPLWLLFTAGETVFTGYTYFTSFSVFGTGIYCTHVYIYIYSIYISPPPPPQRVGMAGNFRSSGSP